MIARELRQIHTDGFNGTRIDDTILRDITFELRDTTRFARKALKNKMR